MSIRWKLLWSYAAMLIIPVLFLVLISGLLLGRIGQTREQRQ